MYGEDEERGASRDKQAAASSAAFALVKEDLSLKTLECYRDVNLILFSQGGVTVDTTPVKST